MNENTLTEPVAMAQQAGAANDKPHTASARVETANAARYMKALCNHFDRKGTASYEGMHGQVSFPFGSSTLEAQPDALLIGIEAENAELLERVKHVVADHLIRFGVKEELQVVWDAA